MPLTPAEKQKRYREKSDADEKRKQSYLESEKRRYINNKTVGNKNDK